MEQKPNISIQFIFAFALATVAIGTTLAIGILSWQEKAIPEILGQIIILVIGALAGMFVPKD